VNGGGSHQSYFGKKKKKKKRFFTERKDRQQLGDSLNMDEYYENAMKMAQTHL
jgi:hypothetical protein